MDSNRTNRLQLRNTEPFHKCHPQREAIDIVAKCHQGRVWVYLQVKVQRYTKCQRGKKEH